MDPGLPAPGRMRQDRIEQAVLYGLTAIYVLYAAYDLQGWFRGVLVFDLMLLTGGLACLAGLFLSTGARTRMHAMIAALRERAALLATPEQIETLHRLIEERARPRRRATAIIVGAAIAGVVTSGFALVPWLVHRRPLYGVTTDGVTFIGTSDAIFFVVLLVVAIVAGVVVGGKLGELSSYGEIDTTIRDAGGRLGGRGDPSSLGGLLPLVEFLRRQATLTLIPAAWIGLWLILTSFPFWLGQYGLWRFPFFLLFALAVFYAWQGFLTPTRALGRLADGLDRSAAAIRDETQRVLLAGIAARIRQRMILTPNRFLAVLALLVAAVLLSGMALPGRGATWLSLFAFGPA